MVAPSTSTLTRLTPVLSEASKPSGWLPATQLAPLVQSPVPFEMDGGSLSSSVIVMSSHWLWTKPLGQPVVWTHQETRRRLSSASPDLVTRVEGTLPPGPGSQPQ